MKRSTLLIIVSALLLLAGIATSIYACGGYGSTQGTEDQCGGDIELRRVTSSFEELFQRGIPDTLLHGLNRIGRHYGPPLNLFHAARAVSATDSS